MLMAGSRSDGGAPGLLETQVGEEGVPAFASLGEVAGAK
jgi:hypothetical protein